VRLARPALLGLALFPVGFATHETMHLLIYTVFGVPAALVVTRWSVGVGSLAIAGLHAAPLGAAGVGGPDRAVPLWLLVLNNGLGPLLAASFLIVLWASVTRRSRVARTALLANAAVLAFFSLIEVAYPLLEDVAGVDADVLLLPAVNYGGALLVLLGVVAASARPGAGHRPRVIGPGSVDRSAGRLPAP
jgi:hypothetical protein